MGSNVENTRKQKRKTDWEIFFEEEPAFSDSEEEAKFLQSSWLHINKKNISPKTSQKEKVQESTKLLDDILKSCCSKCDCCQKIKNLIKNSQKPSDLSCSPTSGFKTQLHFSSTETKKLQHRNVDNRKIRIISDKLLNENNNDVIPKNTDSQENEINKIKSVLTKIDKNSDSQTKKSTKRTAKTKKYGLIQNPAIEQQVSDTCELKDLDEDKIEMEDSTSALIEKKVDEESTPNVKKRITKRKGNPKKFQEKDKNPASCPTFISEFNSETLDLIANSSNTKEDFVLYINNKTRKTLNIERKKRAINLPSTSRNLRKITSDTDSDDLKNKENTKLNEGENKRVKKRKKRKRLSMPNWYTFGPRRDLDSSLEDPGIRRRSFRERQQIKKYKAETDLNGKRKAVNRMTKSIYNMVDKRIFNLPIDTTKNTGFARSIVRKLARRAGCILSVSVNAHKRSCF